MVNHSAINLYNIKFGQGYTADVYEETLDYTFLPKKGLFLLLQPFFSYFSIATSCGKQCGETFHGSSQ